MALQLEIDEELRREGLAREIVRAVQNARKEAGLEITDRIALGLGGDAGAARGRPRARGLHRRRDAGDQRRPRRRQRRRGRASRHDRRPRAADLRQPGLSRSARRAAVALAQPLRCAALARARRCLCRRARSPPAAPPASESATAASIGPGQRPQLLLIHGGSFLFEDPTFEPLTRAARDRRGLRPPLRHLSARQPPGGGRQVRAEARRLREKFGVDRVYAYGASAGGTLAALLSGDDLVAAAVAKAPVSDLVTWEWPTRALRRRTTGKASASTSPTANGSRRSAARSCARCC